MAIRDTLLLKLQEGHPSFKKMEALFQYMEENGIQLFPNAQSTLNCSVDGQNFLLADTDNGENVVDFPPAFEYKMTMRVTPHCRHRDRHTPAPTSPKVRYHY